MPEPPEVRLANEQNSRACAPPCVRLANEQNSRACAPPCVRLANDIAAQFRHRGPEEAAEVIAAHLRAFWDPRMRAALLAHIEAGAGGLDPLAVRAAALLEAGPG